MEPLWGVRALDLQNKKTVSITKSSKPDVSSWKILLKLVQIPQLIGRQLEKPGSEKAQKLITWCRSVTPPTSVKILCSAHRSAWRAALKSATTSYCPDR